MARERGQEWEPPASLRWQDGMGHQEGPGAWRWSHCRVLQGHLCPARPCHGVTSIGMCWQPRDTSQALMRPFAELQLGLLDAAECGVCKGLPQGWGPALMGTGGMQQSCFWRCLCLAGCLAACHSLTPRGIKTCCGTMVSLGVSWGQLMGAADGVFSSSSTFPALPHPEHPYREMHTPQVLLDASSRGCLLPGSVPLTCPTAACSSGWSLPPPAPKGAQWGLALATPAPVPMRRALPGQDGWEAAPWSSTWGSAMPCQGRAPSLLGTEEGYEGSVPQGSPLPSAEGTTMGLGIPRAGPGPSVALQPLTRQQGRQGWILPSVGTQAIPSSSPHGCPLHPGAAPSPGHR
ncbi:uncharacterized protein LOC121083682 [Falco naumanni]|uniref:uncharacterized protein LOC121083682 n=1 Tax=Falco naumanni TaxID=148594 RepID=UPI001ADE8CE8|nr:uncharacterized protein LOC121083682 [Falco naumanni]